MEQQHLVDDGLIYYHVGLLNYEVRIYYLLSISHLVKSDQPLCTKHGYCVLHLS